MATKRTKVEELSIFTIGIGIIIAALSVWAAFVLTPAPGTEASYLWLGIPVGLGGLFIVLGGLLRRFPSPVLVLTILFAVVGGLLLDLVVGFNMAKAAISLVIIVLILKSGLDALAEVGMPIGGRKSGTPNSSLEED